MKLGKDESQGESQDLGKILKLAKAVHLPPQPRIVMAVNAELQNDEPSFKRISDLLAADAAMSAKVLKIVNSPLYRREKRCDSIDSALMRLGLKPFYSTVLVSCLRDALGGMATGAAVEMEQLWDHCEVVAQLCREIAAKGSEVSPEHAYMAGLFHDAAIPAMMERFPDYRSVLQKVISEGGNIQEYETDHVGTHHAVVGYLLAKSWGLPEDVMEAIQLHHTEDLSIYTDNARSLGAILILADHCSIVGIEHLKEEPPYWQALQGQIVTQLSLDEDDLTDICELAAELTA